MVASESGLPLPYERPVMPPALIAATGTEVAEQVQAIAETAVDRWVRGKLPNNPTLMAIGEVAAFSIGNHSTWDDYRLYPKSAAASATARRVSRSISGVTAALKQAFRGSEGPDNLSHYLIHTAGPDLSYELPDGISALSYLCKTSGYDAVQRENGFQEVTVVLPTDQALSLMELTGGNQEAGISGVADAAEVWFQTVAQGLTASSPSAQDYRRLPASRIVLIPNGKELIDLETNDQILGYIEREGTVLSYSSPWDDRRVQMSTS